MPIRMVSHPLLVDGFEPGARRHDEHGGGAGRNRGGNRGGDQEQSGHGAYAANIAVRSICAKSA